MRSSRLGALATLVALQLAAGPVRAQDPAAPTVPPAAPVASSGGPSGAPAPPLPAAAPAAASTPSKATPKGAVVVALSDAASPAARALAFDVYRAPDLRPTLDDATARVLIGEPLPEGASAHLKETAELRATLGKGSGADLVERRVLASVGAEAGAALVVTVAMDGAHPVARVLRTSTAAFERVELGPTVDIAADGARTFRWPGAVTTLSTLILPPPPPAPVPPTADGATPLAPKSDTTIPLPLLGENPFYKSPWFWGAVGGAVVVGVSVFLITRQTSSSSSNVHLTGMVGP